MIKNIVISACCFFSALSFAGNQVGIISKIVAHDNGAGSEKIDIRISGPSSAMDWCSDTQEWVLVLNNELAKAQFSMLLSAYMAGKEVHIDSDGSKNCPDGGRNRVRNVKLN